MSLRSMTRRARAGREAEVLIEVGTPEFDRLFKTADPWGQFESFLPAHDTYVAAMADPSLDPFAEVNVDLLRYQGVADLQRGTQNMATKIMRPGGPEGTFGFLASSTQALENIMQMPELEEFMSPDQVFSSLGVAVGSQDPAQAIKDVTFAVGMTALGSMGPVGAAAAAIIGFARAVGEIFKRKKAFEEDQKREALIEAYKSFPPLMEPRNNVDQDSVNLQLLPQLQTGDWTKIFSPRFAGEAWQAVPRQGGYALALGDAEDGAKDPLGEPLKTFIPTGGIGYWPGQNRITSVLQVSLNPASQTVQRFLKGEYAPNDYLIEQWMVRDTGDFLVNTTRLAAVAWEWVARSENSPHLFKVNVPALHTAWSEYCLKGMVALTQRSQSSRKERDLYISALSCTLGSWQCWFDKGRYRNIDGRLHGRNMGDRGGPKTWHPNRSPRQGCVITPYEAGLGDPRCLSTIYDLETRLVLDQVAERQRWYLRHSLLCAYVRQSWAAFQGSANKKLRDLLNEMRMLLLDHPDRQYVALDDVPPGEKLPNGLDLKAELKRRGAGKVIGGKRFAINPGTLEPPTEPVPGVGSSGGLPFGGNTLGLPPHEPEYEWWRDRRVVGAGLGLLVGGGLLWWNRR